MYLSQLFGTAINEAVEEEVFFDVKDPDLYDIIADRFFGNISWHGTVMAVSKDTWAKIQHAADQMGFDPQTDLEQLKESIDEVLVVHDTGERTNPRVIPDGGIGSWDVDSLRSNLIRQLSEIVKMIDHNAQGAEYLLYRAGAIKSKLDALSKVERYLEKLGRRAVRKDKEVDLG